jgi:TetR/AcrR family transcriptional repressor of nem operon
MSPLDQRFRRRVNATFDLWIDAVAKDLARGQAEGTIRRDVDARNIAQFVVASIEGSFGLAKGAQSATMLRANLEVLGIFLEGLRPQEPQTRKKKPARKKK